MCSNYLFPSKRDLSLLGVDASQFDLEIKDHVYPSYHAPIILNGADQFELDIAKARMAKPKLIPVLRTVN